MTARNASPADAAEEDAHHRYRIRVFYEDTDAGGIVYHANYLKFAERARTEYLREIGVGQRDLRAAEGLGFAVRRCTVDYRAAAVLDDLLEVRTRIDRVGGASIEATQRIFRLGAAADGSDSRWDGKPALCTLVLRIACVNSDGQAARFPPQLRGALAAAIGRTATSETG